MRSETPSRSTVPPPIFEKIIPVASEPVVQPPHRKGSKKKPKTKTAQQKVQKPLPLAVKIIIWIVIIAIIYIFWSPIKFSLLHILQLNPTVWALYLQASHEISSQSLFGLFLTAFFGALFFVSIPVELVFLYYLTLGFTPWEVLVYVTIGNLLGMMVNYFVGFVLGPKIMKKWLKENYVVVQKKTKKYGDLMIVIGNIIPFPIEIVSLFFGGVRYNFVKFFLYTLLGKAIKFVLLFVGYTYFSEELSGFWQETLWPPLKKLYESYILPIKGIF